MHGTMNLKFANVKQAKETPEYRNITQKLHKTTAAIWFNNPDDGHKSARNM
jgi:hypothetical protein